MCLFTLWDGMWPALKLRRLNSSFNLVSSDSETEVETRPKALAKTRTDDRSSTTNSTAFTATPTAQTAGPTVSASTASHTAELDDPTVSVSTANPTATLVIDANVSTPGLDDLNMLLGEESDEMFSTMLCDHLADRYFNRVERPIDWDPDCPRAYRFTAASTVTASTSISKTAPTVIASIANQKVTPRLTESQLEALIE